LSLPFSIAEPERFWPEDVEDTGGGLCRSIEIVAADHVEATELGAAQPELNLFDVAPALLHMIIADIAIGAHQLHGFVRHADHHLRGVIFADARLAQQGLGMLRTVVFRLAHHMGHQKKMLIARQPEGQNGFQAL